jgi:TonB family protein
MLLNSSHQVSNVLSKAARALALTLALTAAACDQSPVSAQKPAASPTPAAPQASPTPQAPAAVPVTLDETLWAVSDSFKNSYVFEFKKGGVFRYTSSDGTAGGGKWTREADSVVVRPDGGAAGEYRGVFNGRSRIDGDATLADKRALKWQARREEAQPVASKSAPPFYPDDALAARAEGVVLVEVKVDAAGHAAGARAVSGHALLQQAAVEASERWQFNPEPGTETRTTRLLFIFQIVPADCGKKPRPPAPAPEFLTGYQMRVKRPAECVN